MAKLYFLNKLIQMKISHHETCCQISDFDDYVLRKNDQTFL